MKMIKSYLQYRKGVFIFFLFNYITEAIILYLSNVPIASAVYAVYFCLFIGVFVVAFDFYRFCNKMKLLSFGQLPDIENKIDACYQQLILQQKDEMNEWKSTTDKNKQDAMDYYTMWVHQIKTPIAAMRLLLQNSNQKEVSTQFQDIESELFRIEQYVEMVLSYQRMESDYTDYIINQYDLESIARSAVRKFAKLFIRKKIKIELRDLEGMVLTDEKWILFVIEQILSNAIKYTSKGCISIYQSPKKVLVIEDTGIGIAKEDIPRVFDRGYTGYNGRMHMKSTGIGLYLCKSIVNKLGHRIWLESTVGVGTKVFLDLRTQNIEIE